MCGIIAYTGHQAATPIILQGLRSLEYRGYDSAGISYVFQDNIVCIKAPGKLSALEDAITGHNTAYLPTCGIGHTRWATHGAPTLENAHPHASSDGSLVIIHNGIIENFRTLKDSLLYKGYNFKSETDTEVLANLISEERKSAPDNLTAFRNAIIKADGAYAIALLFRDEPDTVYATRKSAPMIAGIGTGENFVASDVTAFMHYTRKVIFMDEGEIIKITPSAYSIFKIDDLSLLEKEIQTIEWDAQSAQKGGYKHFMLKEIFEQPNVLRSAMAGRLSEEKNAVQLPELDDLPMPERLRIVACGTSYNAGLWASSLLEQWGGVPVSVEIASEFRYRKPLLGKNELVVLISQSGETADTLAALQIAREHGCTTLGLCNVTGSSIARSADRVLYTQAGPEISVASTKALCSQMAVLTLMAIYFGQRTRTLSEEANADAIRRLSEVADVLEKYLPEMREQSIPFAQRASEARNIFFIGRGPSYALAMEGALKLKELSYIHAEAYAAGELKHGPIALIDQEFLTFALAPQDEYFAKTASNIEEVAARHGPVVVLTEEGDISFQLKDGIKWLMPTLEAPYSSFIMLPMLQLLSYDAANLLGKDVDQPRNLAKSVTVE